MEDLPTHPAVLATETVPVPLTIASPLASDQPSNTGSAFSLVWKVLALVLVLYWISKHWLQD